MLERQDFGTAGGPPLIIGHGLFGSGRNWGAIARRLSDTRHVVTVDMRNHGASPWTEQHGYPDMAADLADLIDGLSSGAADVLGHSMGGKAAMQLALTAPDKVRKLVVADIAPVAYGHSQQRMIDAMRSVDLSRVEKRSDADAQLARAIDEPGVRAFLLQSLDVPARAWRLNLDTLEAEMPKILGWPGTPGTFEGPTLFLTGAESDYVRPEHRGPIRVQFPKARFAKIPGAGHWLHADHPREFEAAVRAFLDA
ncbi:alpha/beta fold hydrolase [Palleronia sp. KMU-117]|uniref:alpha/beta fold hydrolase n=1 Tax=Palleronia sp. KMU-117 TaxID=3434108 RepID=UPI003D70C9BD